MGSAARAAFSVKTQKNVTEEPLMRPLNIYSCDRSEKSKCPFQGGPWPCSALPCIPDHTGPSAPAHTLAPTTE